MAEGMADAGALRRIAKTAALLKRRLNLKTDGNTHLDAGRLLAWAYPDRIAARRPDQPNRYLMTNGSGAFFDPPEALSAHDFLVIAELDGERRDARIFMAAAYDRETLLEQFNHRLQWRQNVTWDDRRQAVSAERRLCLDALILRSEPIPDPDPGAVTSAMLAGIHRSGIDALPWTPSLRSWQARVMLLRRLEAASEPWPDLSDAALSETLAQWLGPYLERVTSMKALARLDLRAALQAQLTWKQRQLLERLAPTHWRVPSGSRQPIDYSAEVPILAVRLQEMFGCAQTPSIADGRQPLQLHLLSPAGRPAQVTQDLAGFWQNSYPAVKKELMGRYPKHEWPDDPLNARPTARAKPRKRAIPPVNSR